MNSACHCHRLVDHSAHSIAVMAMVVPTAVTSPPLPMDMRRATEGLRSLHLRPGTILEAGPGFAALAGYDYPMVAGWMKREPLLALLSEHDVRVVILWQRYMTRDSFARDPDVALFTQDPRRYGFEEVSAHPGFVRISRRLRILAFDSYEGKKP